MSKYHCTTCNKEMSKKSKYGHLKSKSHLFKVQQIEKLKDKVANKIS